MPDRLRPPAPPRADPLVASARLLTQPNPGDRTLLQYESWQAEAWGFWRSLGPFNYGVGWLANALSRVRLTAAELVPGGDEPAPLTEGPAADLMEQFAGGMPGQAAIMKALAQQLSVPGEGWIVARRTDAKTPLWAADWSVRSTDSIRPSRGKTADWEVRTDETVWEPLLGDSLVARVWEQDPQYPWRAHSSAQPAVPIMRRIDLLERRIVATLVSRLAMNGILLIPQEATITTPPQYADADDPFTRMLIDIASNNIRNPGNASASIPIPIRFAAEFIDKWKHITFGDGIDEHLLAEREAEIRLLATTLNMPAEVLLGLGDTSHWNAWQIEESGIKLHISPIAETICGGLTVGYLHPMLTDAGKEVLGPNGGKVVVWYDPSELTARPDKSAAALNAYDRIELSGAGLRRESGLDEADAPTVDEVREQILKQLALTAQTAMQALAELTGQPMTPVSGAPQPSGPGVPGDGSEVPSPGPADAPDTGPPGTRDEPPPPPGPDTPTAAAGRISGLGRLPTALLPASARNGGAGWRAPPPPVPAKVNGHGGKSRDGPKGRR